MTKTEKFNEWIAQNIPVIEAEEFCEINSILDWLMQKSWSKTLTYQSWPDGETHTVNEGLNKTFEFVNKLYSHIQNVKMIYNNKLYDEMMSRVEEVSEEKLREIKKILES